MESSEHNWANISETIYRQLALSWGKKAPTSVFSKFNPLNTDTPFTDTFEFHGSLSACVLTGFDCRNLVKIFHFES